MSQPDDDSFLQSRIEEALECLDRGGTVVPSDLCRDRPDLADRLRRALEVRSRLPMLSKRDPQLARVLAGRYEIRSVLGQGATGVVFEGFDRSLRRPVAIKVLQRDRFVGSEQHERFRREARAVAGLRHASIVAIHDQGVDEVEQAPFLVMDLVRGVDLATLLRRARERGSEDRKHATGLLLATGFPPEAGAMDQPFWQQPYPVVAASLVRSVGHALAMAHAQGVVHRDVKPSNILVEPTGNPVLVDFGLAQVPGEHTLTRTGNVLGTPWYMAPEQATGNSHRVGPAADLYALGATLYHLLALRPPFEDDLFGILRRVRTEEPAPLRRLQPSLPRDLATLCAKAMEKRPTDRYPSVSGLIEDISAFLEFRPINASPPTAWMRLVRIARRRPERVAWVVLLTLLAPAGWATAHAAQSSVSRARVIRVEQARGFVPPAVSFTGRNAAAYFGARQPDRAGLAALDKVLAQDPDDEESLLLRSMLHLDAARVAEGMRDLRRLAALHPESHLLPTLLTMLPQALRDPGWADQLPGSLPPPEQPFDQWLSGCLWLRAPSVPNAVNSGLALLRQAADQLGERSSAAHMLLIALMLADRPEEALAGAARQEGARGGPGARTRYVTGWAHSRRGRYADAGKAFEDVLARCPEHDRSWHNLGLVHKRLGRPVEALECFERAALIEPAAIKTVEELCKAYRERRDWQRAELLLARLPNEGEQAVRRAHVEGRLRREQAEAAGEQGDAEGRRARLLDAHRCFESALAAAPDAMRVRITCDLAITRDQLGDADGVLAQILAGLEGEEADAESLLLAALILRRDRSAPPEVVLHFLHAAHRADPTHQHAALDLASTLAETSGDLGAAIAVLMDSFTVAPWPGRAVDLAEGILDRSADAPEFIARLDRLVRAGAFAAQQPATHLCRRLQEIADHGQPALPPNLNSLLSRSPEPAK